MGHLHPDEDRLYHNCPACRMRVVDDQITAAVAEAPTRLVWVGYEALGREYDFSIRLPWPTGFPHRDLFRYWTGHPMTEGGLRRMAAREPLRAAIVADLRKHEAGTLLARAIDDIRVHFLEVDVSTPPEKSPPDEIEGQQSLFG